ncbi:hypothetical protein K438DRAFT_1961011 [Mycena galopus ATCC 62051]|nr:hypothetical protein K438DRAFT_1986171 [Mycena galopus ATCC 62051]KAF8209285.1 hypothetical protein K438DRAFT_1961011 [Mycena galopus ATCC 62051]
MPSPIPGSLSNKNEDIVRKLFKTLRATKFEDPLDQDSFLVESATTVLEFRPQIASFALVPDLGECIFLIRSMMHANNARLDSPPSDTFTSIQDFAGEIVRKRQTLRERKRANLERARVAEGAAARLERKAALEHATKVTDSQGPRSSADDVVSIPSSEDEAEPVFSLKNPPPSPISVDLTNVAPCSKAVPLSPSDSLGYHLSRMSLSAYPDLCGPRSLSSLSPSLPDLVPDFALSQHRLPVKGGGPTRGRTTIRKRRRSLADVPIAQCNTFRMVQLPFGPPPPAQKNNFVRDWLSSRPKPADSPMTKKKYTGNYVPSVNPNHVKRRHYRKKSKRCYYCSAADHLVALCPMRESID